VKFWFIPTKSGDFRLVRPDGDDDSCSVLEAENPTEPEMKKLSVFLGKALEQSWLDEVPTISSTGKTTIELSASVDVAGPVLASVTIEEMETWTAVRSEDGSVVLVDGTEIPEKTEEKPEQQAAASLAKPKRGCPAPRRCNRRASEVLRVFSTASQWSDWERTGSMKLVGSRSGKSYRLYHRDEAAKQGLDRVLVDVESRRTVCIWDDRVPAEEEALGIKLMVEHREAEVDFGFGMVISGLAIG